MRKIIVEQGNEFKIKIREIKDKNEATDIFEDDVFGDAYKQAAARVEEIVTETDRLSNIPEEEKKSDVDYLNNIIAFTGERGQGKSSAMLSFTQYLENSKNKQVFNENTRNYRFVALETIDPSTFEDMHNVLEVITARMYINFAKKYEKDNSCIKKDKKNEIMALFQEVYESLCLIRNRKKLEELEYDYEGSIQKIVQIGDSTILKKKVEKLVKEYLRIMVNENEKGILVVPIDDLDINIEHAYKITEQIRKYLIIPNVIIVMAINVDQLKKCVENEFRKQLLYLINEERRLNKNDIIEMAAKYVEKLIPDGRKINLPEVRVISQSGKNAVELVYQDRKKNNILDKYQYNKDSDEKEEDSQELGIEKKLLAYINDKTGIVFVKPKDGIHPIVPNTMRELVNLLSVLGKMEENTGDSSDAKASRLKNIDQFEDYFLHTWIPENLDDGYIKIIDELSHTPTYKKHRFICLKMMGMLEKQEGTYTVDEKIDKENAELKPTGVSIDRLRKKFSNKNINCMSYAIGDAVTLIDTLSARFIDYKISNFTFAIKTIYTITMHRLAYSLEETKNKSNESDPNEIYKFVGGNLWGNTRSRMIRAKREKFEFVPLNVLKDKLPEGVSIKDHITNQDLAKAVLYMAFFTNFPNKDQTRKERDVDIVYLRKYIQNKEVAKFCLDNLFISPLDLQQTYYRSGLARNNPFYNEYLGKIKQEVQCELLVKIVVNYELNEHIKQSCIESSDYKEEAEDKDYAEDFVKRVQNALKQIDYITYFENEYFILSGINNTKTPKELGEMFIKIFENRIPDTKKTGKDKKPKAITVNPDVKKMITLDSHIKTIVSNMEYYQSNYETNFSKDIIASINEAQTLCKYAIDRDGAKSAIVDDELRAKYKYVAQIVQRVIKSAMKNQQQE